MIARKHKISTYGSISQVSESTNSNDITSHQSSPLTTTSTAEHSIKTKTESKADFMNHRSNKSDEFMEKKRKEELKTKISHPRDIMIIQDDKIAHDSQNTLSLEISPSSSIMGLSSSSLVGSSSSSILPPSISLPPPPSSSSSSSSSSSHLNQNENVIFQSEIYHERQSKMFCAMHAVNNLLQLKRHDRLTSKTMDKIADEMFEREKKVYLEVFAGDFQETNQDIGGNTTTTTTTTTTTGSSKKKNKNKNKKIKQPKVNILNNHKTKYFLIGSMGNYSFEVIHEALKRLGYSMDVIKYPVLNQKKNMDSPDAITDTSPSSLSSLALINEHVNRQSNYLLDTTVIEGAVNNHCKGKNYHIDWANLDDPNVIGLIINVQYFQVLKVPPSKSSSDIPSTSLFSCFANIFHGLSKSTSSAPSTKGQNDDSIYIDKSDPTIMKKRIGGHWFSLGKVYIESANIQNKASKLDIEKKMILNTAEHSQSMTPVTTATTTTTNNFRDEKSISVPLKSDSMRDSRNYIWFNHDSKFSKAVPFKNVSEVYEYLDLLHSEKDFIQVWKIKSSTNECESNR